MSFNNKLRNYIPMKLIAKTLQQEKIEIDIDEKDTVEMAKKLVAEKKNTTFENVKMIFNGQILDNKKTLEEYAIKENCQVVILIQKPKEEHPKPKEQESKPKEDNSKLKEKDSEPKAAAPSNDNGYTPAPPNIPAQPPINLFAPMQNLQNLNLNGNLQNLPINSSVLGQLLQNPQIQQMVMSILQNPQLSQGMLNNPEMVENLVGNFESILEEEPALDLTQEEKEDIEGLVSLGFDRADSVQYYLACGKNKELAASMLFENTNLEED